MNFKKKQICLLIASTLVCYTSLSHSQETEKESLLTKIILDHPHLLIGADKSKATNENNVVKPDISLNANKIEGRVIVRLKSGEDSLDLINSLNNKGIAHQITKSFDVVSGPRFGGPSISQIIKQKILVIYASGQSTDSLIQLIQKNPTVDIVEPDYIVSIKEASLTPLSDVIGVNATPTDPLYNELWGMNNTAQTGGTAGADIDAERAWDIIHNAPNQIVGIIDTGVDYLHPDLVANIWHNPGEIPNDGIDNDGNGYIDDIHGIDAFNGDSDPMDDNNHGTHTAGTIGAVGQNNKGVVGVNWDVKIAACKFLGADGFGLTSGAIECVNYFTDLALSGNNVVVTNNSWGGGLFSDST